MLFVELQDENMPKLPKRSMSERKGAIVVLGTLLWKQSDIELIVSAGLSPWNFRILNKQKSVRADTLSLVPLFEALECPLQWNEQTQRPHAEYIMPIQALSCLISADDTYPHKLLLFATSLTAIEIFQISKSQEEAPSIRFFQNVLQPRHTSPLTGSLLLRSALQR